MVLCPAGEVLLELSTVQYSTVPAGEVLLELSGRPTRPAVTSPSLEHGEGRGGERVETLTVEGFNLDIVIHNIWRRPFTSLFLSAFFTSPLALLFYHRF